MKNQDKLVDFLSKTFESVENREMYFLGTPDEYDKFVNGIAQIHNEDRIAKQNEYFKTKWNNRNEKSNQKSFN